jgi:hypothetical protein
MSIPSSQKEAKAVGASHYFTGIPCKRGHVARRSVKNSVCLDCANVKAKQWQEARPGYRTQSSNRWRGNNPEAAAKQTAKANRKRRAQAPDLTRAEGKRYRDTHQDQIKAYAQQYNKTTTMLLSGIKCRCKKRGFEYNLTSDDVHIPELCPILGIPLFRSTNVRTNNSPTVDRIDNSRGYVKGNVHVISWRANRLKNDGTYEELKAIVDHLTKLREHK